MATPNQIRVVAITLQESVQALKDAIDPIQAVTSTWTVNDLDANLPAEADVKTQTEAYEAIQKKALRLSDALSAVKQGT